MPLEISHSHNNDIVNNTLINNIKPTTLNDANYNILSGNTDNKNGFFLVDSNNNRLSNNMFHAEEPGEGISLQRSYNNTVITNIMSCDNVNSGIFLRSSSSNNISYNEINATMGYSNLRYRG